MEESSASRSDQSWERSCEVEMRGGRRSTPMMRFRRVCAWLLVSVLVFMLVATLILDPVAS